MIEDRVFDIGRRHIRIKDACLGEHVGETEGEADKTGGKGYKNEVE